MEATTLAALVTEYPRAARVLHRHRLDFCCGGQRTLADACGAAGLDAAVVLDEIAREGAAGVEVRPEDLSAAQLIDHIVHRYHVPLRAEIVRLAELALRVERVHGAKPECPRGLAAHLQEMREAVEVHLDKEEQILFPLIRSGRGAFAQTPIQVMVREHRDHAENLQRVRALTDDLRVPECACASWRALYDGLGGLELELMEHIHLENNVLFPSVLAG